MDTELSPRLRWSQILAISIFWFGLSFHWAALGFIILPSQVLKLVGEPGKGAALAFVLIPGAFVALFANPFFGLLSDRTTGRLARLGKRRPYILIGTLLNAGALLWMALAPDLLQLMLAYLLVQLTSNAVQAPFHALLPDIVPAAQRGQVSGTMGLLQIAGTIGGTLVSGLLIDTGKPTYFTGLWLAYGIVIVVLLVLMLVTVLVVRERGESVTVQTPKRKPWLTRSHLLTTGITLLSLALVWGLLALWNLLRPVGIQISSEAQQVILEIIAAIGLLRIFEFSPRRTPSFAWVLVTRLFVMLSVYTIQTYLLYFMQDVVRVDSPALQTSNFIILVSITSLISAFVAGWLSDRFGRKRIIYISGTLMALVGLIFIVSSSLPIVISAGLIFGLGYGAYQSVDWALVADTLPSRETFARDMGVWNIALAIPQIIAPVIGGPLIDHFYRIGQSTLGFQLLFTLAILYCLIGTVTVRYIRVVNQ
ncbi:MFS transporter [Thermosporothrix hazakensis]|uniref:MFS transporter n=2 Tax=Thermosporothrix TaxID=768650 RepID=A0A326TZX7_THEHA|nr:MFS transporter [Thermosporothrix hazakensis]PZW23325.1 MFS transporter [Thermosporothrix hazakensis]